MIFSTCCEIQFHFHKRIPLFQRAQDALLIVEPQGFLDFVRVGSGDDGNIIQRLPAQVLPNVSVNIQLAFVIISVLTYSFCIMGL